MYFVELFLKVLPYLLLSIALNIAVTRYFRGRKFNFSLQSQYETIFLAALVGLVSPLPTYAAIPIGLSFLTVGVPFSAIVAFIIASPLMNPTVFFLTATQLGMEMAVVRTLAAFVFAIVGGFISIKVLQYPSQRNPPTEEGQPPIARPLSKEILGNALYMLKFFSLAILLSAAVRALIAPEVIARLLGGNAKVSTLVAIGMGVPFYTCGGSAIPFMQTLMEMGMSKGATLAFFLAGPATKLETLYAYKTMLGTKVLVFFLVLTLVFSYIAGVLYSYV
ncbi:MAG: permease [Ignavibacteriales bacterium]|nr:permease [Ignavibacteriales bacterium]